MPRWSALAGIGRQVDCEGALIKLGGLPGGRRSEARLILRLAPCQFAGQTAGIDPERTFMVGIMNGP